MSIDRMSDMREQEVEPEPDLDPYNTSPKKERNHRRHGIPPFLSLYGFKSSDFCFAVPAMRMAVMHLTSLSRFQMLHQLSATVLNASVVYYGSTALVDLKFFHQNDFLRAINLLALLW